MNAKPVAMRTYFCSSENWNAFMVIPIGGGLSKLFFPGFIGKPV